MAKELDVAFDELVSAICELKKSIIDEQWKTNSRLDRIETETIITKETVKSAAQMILKNLE